MFHPKCEASRPTTAVSSKCKTEGCSQWSEGRHNAMCATCSIEQGKCEACGKSLKQGRRTDGFTAPVLNPDADGGPRSIAPGGCMPRGDGFARAAAMRYFEAVEGFVKIDFDNPAEWVVHLQKPVDKPLPKAVFGYKLRYVFLGSEKVASSWVTVVLTTIHIGPKQAQQLARLEGLKGVVSVERLFPDDTEPYFQRFYTLGFTNEADADEAVAALEDMRSVEKVSKGARRNTQA